jgi:hypothetical protein
MDTSKILTDLRAERDRIIQAIAALESLDSAGSIPARRGRPPITASVAQPTPKRGGRRRMSAAGRARIAAAAKAMWARRKKQAAKPQTSAKQTAPKQVATKHAEGGLTAAGRKRISEMMKARWAARKKAAAKG